MDQIFQDKKSQNYIHTLFFGLSQNIRIDYGDRLLAVEYIEPPEKLQDGTSVIYSKVSYSDSIIALIEYKNGSQNSKSNSRFKALKFQVCKLGLALTNMSSMCIRSSDNIFGLGIQSYDEADCLSTDEDYKEF